jgi:hypothetical protein
MFSKYMSAKCSTGGWSNAGTIGLRVMVVLGAMVWLVGCHRIRVNVETHLIDDAAWQTRLDGPRFAISAPTEAAASSLAYQEVSNLLAEAVKMVRPDMNRAPAGDVENVLFLGMDFRVVDRGTGVAARPVRTHVGFGYGCGPYHGWHHHHHYGYVGTTYESVHLGYGHTMSVSAWVPDDSQPDGRRVLWEGQASLTTTERSPKVTMPYLAVALTSFYGQATEGSVRVKFKPDDERVDTVWRRARHHQATASQ